MTQDTTIIEHRFEIDTEGFKVQMSEIPTWRLIQEILSNSFDELSVKKINCDIEEKNNEINVRIEDDGEGFEDYRDIFTLYKDSYKRTYKDKRGRYNLGEKQLFAVAKTGYVKTRDKFVTFRSDLREVSKIDHHNGTEVFAVLKKQEDFDTTVNWVSKVAVPKGKKLFVNGTQVPEKKLVKKFKCRLPTVISRGKNQKLSRVIEETEIYLYEKNETERPIIFEMGITVQQLQQDMKWHIDIQQKVPQTTSRDVISDSYLQRLYAEITENTIDLISIENCGSNWISEALKKTDEKTSKEILKKRYGTDNVMIQSTNWMANERAIESGVHLVKSGELDADVVSNLKEQGILKYAGQEFAISKWEMAKPVEPTEQMIKFVNVVKAVARDVLNKEITVEYVTTKESTELANYFPEKITMQWNVRVCGGKDFFNKFSPEAIGIMAHELAHDKFGENDGIPHLSHEFIHELERIAGLIGEKGIQYWISKTTS